MAARLFYLSDLPDRHLLKMIKENDRNAFDTLYYKYWGPLFNVAYKRLRDKDACEEIVQDLFVHFYQIRQNIDADVLIGPYLHAALKNRILNHLRNLGRRIKHNKLAARLVPLSENNTDKTISYNALQRSIASCLQKMPTKWREVYELNKQQYYTINEAAEKMGISESRAEKYLRKAIQHLQASLGEFLS